MQVRFFNPGLTYSKHELEFDAEIKRVLLAGKLILQEDVTEFEKALAEFVGVKYAVALNSGTDALELALRACGIKAGDEVITVSNTFKATITAIKRVGATPVIVDIGDDYLMDMKEVEQAITDKTKAIIPVHLSGDVCDMNALLKIVAERDIQIIEDAAQALGAEYAGQMAGSFGAVGCFSFYPAKILGSFGDAGALVTDNERVAVWARNYRNHCKEYPGEDGVNSRMDNLQAAVLNVRMKYLIQNLAMRRAVAEEYQKGLGDIKDIILPAYREGRAWQDYVIRVKNRDILFGVLKANGVETMKPPVLPHIELCVASYLAKTEAYNSEFLRLPCNDNLVPEEVEYVIEVIRKYYAQ